MATLFLGPTPHQSPLFSHRLRVLHAPPPAPATLLSDSALQRKLVYRCSLQSSSSSPSIAQEEEASFPVPPTSELDPLAEESDVLPLRGCKACGRKEVERGCNGEGRIQGGIATFPGFGWWPIKAYRPCPGFVSSGGRYRRRGQSMDEVAFGRGGEGTSKGT